MNIQHNCIVEYKLSLLLYGDLIKNIYSFTIIVDIIQCLEGLTIFTFIEKNFTAHSMTQHKK